MTAHELRIAVSENTGEVSAILDRPPDATCLLVLGHGAGAGMRHAFMDALAARLSAAQIATLRYQFPYMEQGKRRPDHARRLCKTVRAAVTCARVHGQGLPLFAGGKSMGGRMTSLAAADAPLEDVRGLVFFGFPLHPAKKPAVDRGAHLERLDVPLLFLQGDRDALADLDLLRGVLTDVPRHSLQVIAGADHGFHVLKRSGRTDDEVLDELAGHTHRWCQAHA